MRCDGAAHFDEELLFDFADALVGGEDFALVFFQFGRGETLGVDERLLALVVARARGADSAWRFRCSSRRPVEANFERVDAGALALALFHRGDDLLAVLAQIAQLVELGVEAVRMIPGSVASAGGSSAMACFEALADVGEFVDFVVEMAQEIAAALWRSGEEIFEHRKLRERFAQGDEFARRGQAERDAAGEALEIEDAAELFADFVAHDGLLDELRDGVEARFDGVAIDQRAQNPGAKQTRAHACDGDVESGEERCRAAAGASSLKIGLMSSRLRTETGSRTSASCCS